MPTPAARATHEALFPGHSSTLARTDPDLVEVFDDFAFDDVLAQSHLQPRLRLITQLAALIGTGALSEYRVMVGAALTVGVSPVEVKEVVYQAVPYVGMGRAYDFVHATTTSSPNATCRCPCPASPRRPARPAPPRVSPSKNRSSGPTGSLLCTRTPCR